MTDEIRFIDLFSGIGGFRLGLEKTNFEFSGRSGQSLDNNKGRKWGHLLKSDERQTAIRDDRGLERANRPQEDQLPGSLREARRIVHPSLGTRDRRHTPHNYRCVWSNDFNKYANQIYTKNFGEENHVTADIRGINPTDIPDFDLLCAGFPCQAFSAAGKRKGFKETRGTLFFEILRIAEAKRPSLLLLENVKGLLNHDRGRTFTIILQALDELGYWIEWQVLNSKHHGVPQNRERVFIVGHLGGRGGREIFPFIESSKIPDVGDAGKQIASALQSPGHAAGNYRGMNMIDQKSRIRRLTTTECERLQGFPDGWTEGVSDTQRYKALGNAVTVNVIEFLGHRIRESLQ